MENEAKEWLEFERCGFAILPIWSGKNNPQITLKFADGVVAGSKLIPDSENASFSLESVPKEWEDHGVKDVRVDTEPRKSIIFVHMTGQSESLKCTRHYS
ncbi:MAG: hypothetical protein HY644_12605 [Acidobacteria bacterium]|nr:hypothetical protein [Acidobacteriota bacterium]